MQPRESQQDRERDGLHGDAPCADRAELRPAMKDGLSQAVSLVTSDKEEVMSDELKVMSRSDNPLTHHSSLITSLYTLSARYSVNVLRAMETIVITSSTATATSIATSI